MELFNEKILKRIHDLLTRKEETIAVAESVTSGLLQLALSQAEKALEFFQGGITTYNLGQKYKHLQVEPIHAKKMNCVSEKVTQEMALNVCSLFNSQWGIAVTGYATAVPESGNKIFAWYAIAHKGHIVVSAKLNAPKLEALPVQQYYVKKILDALNKKIT